MPAASPQKTMPAQLRQWRIPFDVPRRLQTVVDTPAYLTAAGSFLSEAEREEIGKRIATRYGS